MIKTEKSAARVYTTHNGNGVDSPLNHGAIIFDNSELVNMSVSDLREITKMKVEEMYSKLFPHEKLAVCAVISVMLNRCPFPIHDAETAARVKETLLNVAETDAHEHGLAEYCKQAAAEITVQGGAA